MSKQNDEIEFEFDLMKTVQAAAYLLSLEGGKMEFIRMLKLLYIADRELLLEAGYTLTGDRAYAMKNGPVLSHTYNLIKGTTLDSKQWDDVIDKDRFYLTLKTNLGTDDLCKREIAKLNDVSTRYRDVDTWTLTELTHDFVEWQRSFVPSTSTPISWSELIRERGNSSMIPLICEEEAAARSANRLLETIR
jgi:uncharacterized phage-associated protein